MSLLISLVPLPRVAPMGRRRRSRELALQYLYQWDFYEAKDEGGQVFWEQQHDPEAVKEYARELVAGVKEKRGEIDGLIEAQSSHWKLYRMSRVDRNILRIAVYEMMCRPEVPPKVSIDEAIEIGKRFGTTDSGSFVNGILDQICRKLGKLEQQ